MTETRLARPTRETDITKAYTLPGGRLTSRYEIWMPTGEEDGYVISHRPQGGVLLGGIENLAAHHERGTSLAALLRHIGLISNMQTGSDFEEAHGSFPSVPSLISRLAEIDLPSDHEWPTFKAFSGLRYSPAEGLRAIAENEILLATQAGPDGNFAAVHDMFAHVPTWLALPPIVRARFADFAHNGLHGDFPLQSRISEDPATQTMHSIDIATSYVGIGSYLLAQDEQDPNGLREVYKNRLGVTTREASSLADATFEHVRVLGELTLPEVRPI